MGTLIDEFKRKKKTQNWTWAWNMGKIIDQPSKLQSSNSKNCSTCSIFLKKEWIDGKCMLTCFKN